MTRKPEKPYVSPGMPQLDTSGKTTSFFEFWPAWAMYFPVAIQWLLLSLRHRSLMLPLLANPKLPLSGMVGVAKSELFEQARGQCAEAILPWIKVIRTAPFADEQLPKIVQAMEQANLAFPLVAKPDIGCRGVGVKLVHNEQELAEAFRHYPAGASMLLQKLAQHEAEAGVFYVRHPKAEQGKIVSLALKYMPYVVGDGRSSLKELIAQDPRASELQHLYLPRHQDHLDDIIPEGEAFRLIFAASHSRGAIFRDANDLITPELSAAIDGLMQDLPEFYYGRLDIKFADIEALQAGKGLEIVEINSASSESLHIWDRATPLREAVRSLLFQYRTLFELGAAQRKRGFRPPRLRELLRRWHLERTLTPHYPETD